jgi:hypothetical protein
MNYHYFATGEDALIADGATWVSSTPMPRKISDPGYVSLFGDAMEYYGEDRWGLCNHWQTGGQWGTAEGGWVVRGLPDGMNSSHIDGSVTWGQYIPERPGLPGFYGDRTSFFNTSQIHRRGSG